MLSLSNVEKTYKGHNVFHNVTLDFSEPGIYILQGNNGSGKSTLLKLLSGVIYKTSGTFSKDVVISYLPDKYTMPKLMKVKSYVYHILTGKNKKEEYNRWMALLGIPEKRIGELSKGNQQKLGILQVFSFEADVYLLDEPLDGLDEAARKTLKEIITEKKKEGKIIILSLHARTLFNDLKPRIFDVKEGEIHEKKRKSEPVIHDEPLS